MVTARWVTRSSAASAARSFFAASAAHDSSAFVCPTHRVSVWFSASNADDACAGAGAEAGRAPS
eukprot:176053-Rhodomonas_salina.1